MELLWRTHLHYLDGKPLVSFMKSFANQHKAGIYPNLTSTLLCLGSVFWEFALRCRRGLLFYVVTCVISHLLPQFQSEELEIQTSDSECRNRMGQRRSLRPGWLMTVEFINRWNALCISLPCQVSGLARYRWQTEEIGIFLYRPNVIYICIHTVPTCMHVCASRYESKDLSKLFLYWVV